MKKLGLGSTSCDLAGFEMGRLDKITGMLEGVALGDALGAPHEMHYNIEIPYTGRLEHPVRHKRRFEGYKYRPIGSVTDDFEMSIALARSLVMQGGYNPGMVVRAYQDWANTKPPMGKNTRALFSGVTTVKGYQARAKKVFVNANQLQSNGSLMRASPLACLPNVNAVILDCDLTNPNNVNRYCNWLYVEALRAILRSDKPNGQELFGQVQDLASRLPVQIPDLDKVFEQIVNGQPRSITQSKGWVVHGFYCAMLVLVHFGTTFTQPSSMLDYIVRLGGDTDTNAAIAGAIIGALSGSMGLREDPRCRENLGIITVVQSDRPSCYHPNQIPEIAVGLARLG